MITRIIVALMTAMTPKAHAEHTAATVLCAEAGYNDKNPADPARAALVAWVIDNRVYQAARTFGEKRRRVDIVLDVLNARRQWSHNCKASKLPAWLRVRARHIVEAKMHFAGRPEWMTRDVLFVIAESESKKLGAKWGPRCLAKTTLGLAFYRPCEVSP